MQEWLLILFTAFFCLCSSITAQAQDTIGIKGSLLMLDDKTPHVAVPVEAIRKGEVVALVLSDENGEYQFKNLRSGQYHVRCQVLGGYVYYRATDAALRVTPYETAESTTGRDAGEILYVGRNRPLGNIDLHFAPFKKGVWKHYTYFDGLASHDANCIGMTSDGMMWFGTNGGVSRYDGKRFVNFTTKDGLANNSVSAMYCDPDGVLWFGTKDGVSRFNEGEFINFTEADGLVDNYVVAVHRAPDGGLWFGTGAYNIKGSGASRYDGQTFVNFTVEDGLIDNTIMAIGSGLDGGIWFGAWAGVSRYDGENFVNYSMDGLNVLTIYGDSDGVMWFGTYGGGVFRYDGEEFTSFTAKDGLAGQGVTSIYQDQEGVMWFGTWGGVSRYDGKTFVNFAVEDGLAHRVVMSISSDPNGTMWFGTGSGVSRFDQRTFLNLTVKDGLANNDVQPIYCDPDNVIWAGTRSGVSRYDGKRFTNLTEADGLGHNWVHAIHRDPDGIMWFGTESGGVSRYDGQEIVNLTTEDGLVFDMVFDIHRAVDGGLWFATWGGISRYDGREFSNFSDKHGLGNNTVWAIHSTRDGMVWFGTLGGGASRYDGREFVNFAAKDGLADIIEAIYSDPDGVIWFGTDKGVSRYDGKTFTTFTSEDGLTLGTAYDIHRSADGDLWVGTWGGVSRYDGTMWTTLDTRDGLAANQVYSICEDADGFLWFGTMGGGLNRYHPGTAPPRVRITSVQVKKEQYTNLAAAPDITAGDDVVIEYSAIDFKTVPEKRQYRYHIQAFGKSLSKKEMDSDWRKPTKSDQFAWTPEEPGTYTFEVQAIDRDLNYSDTASVEIKIVPPPFYTRVWFIIGTILAAFLIPTIIYAILLTRRKKPEFEPIQNPYIVGNPIRSKDMFFGRKSDFEFIRIKLGTEDSGLVVVFAGERRSGKTSILFQILEGELGERIVPVLLDMQAMAVDNEAEFFEKLASEISEAFVRMELNPPAVDFHQGNPARAFEGFISEAMQTLEGRGLLLLFDEYELIESKIDDGSLRPEIITFFASLLEAHPRLSFIFTGSLHLEGRNVEYWRVLIGKSLYRRISFLSERDALRLITEPVADRVIYPRGIPERIIRLTAGQPFYTQVMCQNMMDRLNEVERNRVRQEDVDAVAQELADNPLPQMIYFWDGLEQNQKNALSLLGEVLENSDLYASAQTLLNFTQEQNLEQVFQLSDLEKVLADLFVNDVLERERAGEGKYEYRFRVDLFRLWVRQAHSIWQQVA